MQRFFGPLFLKRARLLWSRASPFSAPYALGRASHLIPPLVTTSLLPTPGCQIPGPNCKLQTANCILHTTYCILHTANCQLPTSNCRLPTANCILPTAYCQLPTSNCQLHTADCILPTANCQLHTAIFLGDPSRHTSHGRSRTHFGPMAPHGSIGLVCYRFVMASLRYASRQDFALVANFWKIIPFNGIIRSSNTLN